jgi:hypothetical protein
MGNGLVRDPERVEISEKFVRRGGHYGMSPKNGCRFSEKIMPKQDAKAKCRFNPKSFRFSSLDSALRARLQSRRCLKQ